MSDPCSPCLPINPCYNCGCQESCNCPAPPLYTNESCPNGTIGSNCITLKNDTEICVGINANTTTLTSFVDKIITYVKNVRNRFISTDGSISITPFNDICNDKANIKVNIDPDLNNAIKLRANGLFVAPTSTSPGSGSVEVDPIEFRVSATSYIISGASSKIVTEFIGKNLDFIRNGLPQSILTDEPSYYTWNKVTGSLFIFPNSANGEIFKIKNG